MASKSSSAVKRKQNHDELEPKDHTTCMQKKLKTGHDQLQLTEINDDCLESIFGYLTLNDLVNVAEANWRFISSARAVFVRRYQKMNFYLNLGIIRMRMKNGTDYEIRKDVAIPFFRHFGGKVLGLYVNFLLNIDQDVNTKLEHMIFQYCTATLTRLEWFFCNMDTFKAINKPFENVRELTISKGSLSQQLSLLDIWFPNLIKLHLIYVKPFNPVSLETKFPHLKDLAIYNAEMTIPLASIMQMVRLNPQIKSFRLHCDYDVHCLRSIAENLPQLEDLILQSPGDRFASFADQVVHFKNVTSFLLMVPYYRRNEFVVNMPFAFQRLEQLTLVGFNKFKDQLMSFIVQNKGIRSLNLEPTVDDWDDLTDFDLKTIIMALPNLTTLKFCADLFEIDDLCEILSSKVRVIFLAIVCGRRIV